MTPTLSGPPKVITCDHLLISRCLRGIGIPCGLCQRPAQRALVIENTPMFCWTVSFILQLGQGFFGRSILLSGCALKARDTSHRKLAGAQQAKSHWWFPLRGPLGSFPHFLLSTSMAEKKRRDSRLERLVVTERYCTIGRAEASTIQAHFCLCVWEFFLGEQFLQGPPRFENCNHPPPPQQKGILKQAAQVAALVCCTVPGTESL